MPVSLFHALLAPPVTHGIRKCLRIALFALATGIGPSALPVFATDIFSSMDANGQMRWSTQAWDRSYHKTITLPLDQTSAALPLTSSSAFTLTRGQTELDQRRRRYYPLVARITRRMGVDTALAMAVIEVESGFHNEAISVKGARGLMQLMPATATRYGLRGLRELHDPQRNIEMGVHHLKDLLARYGGHPALAVAAYNAGSQAVARQGQRVPRYAETMLYVPSVLASAARHAPILAQLGTDSAN